MTVVYFVGEIARRYRRISPSHRFFPLPFPRLSFVAAVLRRHGRHDEGQSYSTTDRPGRDGRNRERAEEEGTREQRI